ncbi:MAG: SLC13 family permease, partial [Flavobacteriaceae bacterium]|nr:SLC13 family permease [Flavobacteriaceae bacterium]
LRIRSLSPMINTPLSKWNLDKEYNVMVLRIKRRHPNPLKGIAPFSEFPEPDTMLFYHDIITVKGDTKSINALMIKFRLGLLPQQAIRDEMRHNLINQEVGMTEVLVNPKSVLVGRKVKIGNFFKRYGVQLLAASRNNKPLTDNEIRIKAGDGFIIRGTWADIENLQSQYENLVVCGSPEGLAKDVDNLTSKSFIALGALVLMILLLVLKIVPGAIAALVSAGLVLVSGCIPLPKTYKSINWVSVIMIAAMIPMGLALQKTGVAQMMANGLVNSLGALHPVVLLGGVFLLTTGFSQVINNSATAVLMAPIVILAATSLDVSPKPFMITVAVSASTAFLTPIGTTTNAMVLSAGGYKFKDYLKVGAPLLLLFLVLILVLVPVIWPFVN